MIMCPGPGEPTAGPWRAIELTDLAALVLDHAEKALPGGPHVVAVDGRSGGGKSTLAQQLADTQPNSAVVYVDDIAWHAPMFGWTDLLANGVLEPLRRGEAVSYRPPAWDLHNRAGVIAVPADRTLVIVEGVGAGRRELTGRIDCLIWVQSDYAEAERLGIARDLASGINGGAEATVEFWHAWMAAENPFLQADRPWDRANIIAAGTSTHVRSPDEVLIAARSGHEPS